MTLTDNFLTELDNPTLTRNERILLRCRLASEFIHTGQYEIAREALGEFWHGVGKRPEVENLKPHVAAEVLLQCGVLSSWLDNIKHIAGAQEQAKGLIFESLRMFQAQGRHARVSEAKYELGMCYFRLGAYNDARLMLEQAIHGLEEKDNNHEWESYRKLIPEMNHWTGKQWTQRIERQNLNFRTHLKRLHRRIICFSKSDEMHEAVIKLYIQQHNCLHHF